MTVSNRPSIPAGGVTLRCRGARRSLVLAASLPLLLLSVAAPLALSGCGDQSGETTGPAPPQVKPPRAGANRRGGQANSKTLSFSKKIEEFAADPEERERLRHKFDSLDFEPDFTGMENRDPFRSYVIRQTGVGPSGNGDVGETIKDTQGCKKGHVAPNYPIHDLTLAGIVLRGTKSYALFRDSASYGHIVSKGDCLGQEKARVSSIRTGFVNLQLTPDTSTSEAEPQQKAIQLYPDELLPDTEP